MSPTEQTHHDTRCVGRLAHLDSSDGGVAAFAAGDLGCDQAAHTMQGPGDDGNLLQQQLLLCGQAGKWAGRAGAITGVLILEWLGACAPAVARYACSD